MDTQLLIALLALGAFVGLMAGLLGIGGGGIMVPMLTSVFLWQEMPVDQVVHLALGTAMASIMVTSFSSLRAHHKKGGVHWPVVKAMTPGILIGTLLTTYLVANLNAIFLAGFFSFFMFCAAVQMFIDAKPPATRGLPSKAMLALAGSGIGGISALVSIGGGVLSVPYLHWHNVDIKKAIGTSSALGFPIALSGTLGYIINGWNHSSDIQYAVGFIYLPAFFCVAAVSVFFAPLGVKLNYKLPVGIIKKIFGILLFLLSIKMFLSVFSAS
ncbi:MAG: sulfite exporter TauE/SafE family protein [Agarilytica sp.]